MMAYGENRLGWRVWKTGLYIFISLIAIQCLCILPVWEYIRIYPPLYLVLIYYWILYRPYLIPVEQLVLFSLILDGIYAHPLGFSALRLLIDYMLLVTQKRFLGPQKFLCSWGGFGLFLLADALVYSLLSSCIRQEWAGFLPLVPGIIMAVSLYPVIIAVMNKLTAKHLA